MKFGLCGALTLIGLSVSLYTGIGDKWIQTFTT